MPKAYLPSAKWSLVRLAEIASQNPHWASPKDLDRTDPHLRRLRAAPLKIVRAPLAPKVRPGKGGPRGKVFVLLGPRQVGKTTYLKTTIRQLIEEGVAARQILYLSADTFHSPAEFRRAVDLFLAQHQASEGGVLLFDEITALPSFAHEIKRLADQGTTSRFPILAAGSSSFALRAESEQLPGRGLEGNTRFLRPLGFRRFVAAVAPLLAKASRNGEFSRSLVALTKELGRAESAATSVVGVPKASGALTPFIAQLDYLLTIYLVVGGYPRAAEGVSADAGVLPRIDPELAETLVRDAVGDVGRPPRNSATARRLLQALLDRETKRCSYQALGRAVDVSHHTVIDYLAVMEGSFLLHVLEPIDPKTGRPRPRSEKKFHLADPLLRVALESHLKGVPPDEVAARLVEDEGTMGRALESAAVAHLVRNGEVPYRRDSHAFIGFAYDLKGREVDAVLEGGRVGVEAKWQADVRASDIARVEGVKRLLVLTREDLEADAGDGVDLVPASLALAALTESEAHL